MFSPTEFVSTLDRVGITHVVWIPDSTLGQWDKTLQNAENIELIQVCREGEAWALAAGLYLGGAKPIVIIQCTGLFESGDAMRNIVHDYQLPIYGLIGYRSYLNAESLPGDTCLKFTEPIINAWALDTVFLRDASMKPKFAEHYHSCHEREVPGLCLMAEGAA